MSQFFFNQRTHLVSDVIDGTIIASPWNNLARLESDPAIRIVVRRDLNKKKRGGHFRRRFRARTRARWVYR